MSPAPSPRSLGTFSLLCTLPFFSLVCTPPPPRPPLAFVWPLGGGWGMLWLHMMCA